ncbi:hypothetical protein [Galactobacter caseinivorans]|uniref:hypothetical protein n=1 Tax=Galactobacter caseinivorans TaxID=2676123 RepID=UPI0013146C76|nr:hypothetical protein [Galactobacter caseinivorans]
MTHRTRKPLFSKGTPWSPAPELPGSARLERLNSERAEMLRLEMEMLVWTHQSMR